MIFPNQSADPNDPASYNFTNTDTIMQAIVANGMEPYVRIGDGHDGFVPPDYQLYGQVVSHVIQHYVNGWANGFTMKIKAYEVWNEPDFETPVPPAPNEFWAGTPQQFYQLYGVIATAVKSVDPSKSAQGKGRKS